jgi:undecaprenyl phosphate N,N'-diacetylbacillosamine 1-phosphate transferase
MFYKKFFKRLIDFFASAILLMLLSPLLIVVSLLQVYFHKGKIWFRQQRPGKHGKLFYILKFKTMSDEVDEQEFSSQIIY